MKRDNWIVGEYSVRPAGEPNKCFYCGELVGKEHNGDCVIRHRTVVVDFTIRTTVEVPESWNKEDIEGRYNYSSWCADNLLQLLTDKAENGSGCLCSYVNAELVREADEDDEEGWGCFVDKYES